MFLLPVFVVRHHSEKMIAKNIELPLHQPCGNASPARVATPLLTSQRRPKATGKYYVKMKNYAWANTCKKATVFENVIVVEGKRLQENDIFMRELMANKGADHSIIVTFSMKAYLKINGIWVIP